MTTKIRTREVKIDEQRQHLLFKQIIIQAICDMERAFSSLTRDKKFVAELIDVICNVIKDHLKKVYEKNVF